MDSDDITVIILLLLLFYIWQKRRKELTRQRCLPGTTRKLEDVQNPQFIENKTEEKELSEERPTDSISKKDAYSKLLQKAKVVVDEENDEMKEREETSPSKPDYQGINKKCLKPYIELNDNRSAVKVIKRTDVPEKNVHKTEQGPSAPFQNEAHKGELHVQRRNVKLDRKERKHEQAAIPEEEQLTTDHLNKRTIDIHIPKRENVSELTGTHVPIQKVEQRKATDKAEDEQAGLAVEKALRREMKAEDKAKESTTVGTELTTPKLDDRKAIGNKLESQSSEGANIYEPNMVTRSKSKGISKTSAKAAHEQQHPMRINEKKMISASAQGEHRLPVAEHRKLEENKDRIKTRTEGTIKDQTNKCIKKESTADKESVALGADLSPQTKRRKEACGADMQSRAVGNNILDDALAGPAAIIKQKSPISPTYSEAAKSQGRMLSSKTKVAGSSTKEQQPAASLQVLKRQKKKADGQIQDKEGSVGLDGTTKRRKTEAMADKDNAAVGAEVIALKRRNKEALAAATQSNGADASIVADSNVAKNKVHEHTRVQKLIKETADTETADQGVDIHLDRTNKRGKDEAVADKESAVIGAELVALKRRNPEAASGEVKSHAMDVNITDDSIPTKGKVHVNVSRRKLKKETADIETAAQGVDVDMVRKNKRGKDEAVADKDSAVIGAELVALKRRNPEAASGEMESHAIDVNIPDDSIPTKGKVHGNVSRQKLKKETADIETADQGVDVDMVRKNKRGKDEAVADKDSAVIGAELVALKRRNPEAASGEGKSHAIDVNIPDDSIPTKGKVHGNVSRRKLKKETADIETADQGADIDMVRMNKREKDEAVAGKESAAVGAELFVLKRRNTGTAASEMRSQAVEVNLPDDFVHRDGSHAGKGHLPVTQFDAEESGLNTPKSAGEDAPLSENKSSRRRKHSTKRRRQRTSAGVEHVAANVDLVALVKRSPGTSGASGAQAVGVNLPDNTEHFENMKKKETKKGRKKKSTKKDTGKKNPKLDPEKQAPETAKAISDSEKTEPPKRGRRSLITPRHSKEDLPKEGDAHEPSQIPPKSSKKKKKKTKKGIENKEEAQNEKQRSGDLTAEEVSLDKSKKTKKPKKKTKKAAGIENKEEPQNEKQKSGDLTAEEVSLDKSKKTKKPKKKTKKAAGTENKEEPQNEKQRSGGLTAEEVSLDKSKKTKQPKKKSKKNKSNEKPSQILPDELQPNVIPKAIGEEANAEKSPDAEEKHVAAADDKASKPAVRAKTKRKKKTESKRKGGMNKQVKQENVPVAEETSKQKMDEVEINKKDGNPKKKKKKQKDK